MMNERDETDAIVAGLFPKTEDSKEFWKLAEDASRFCSGETDGVFKTPGGIRIEINHAGQHDPLQRHVAERESPWNRHGERLERRSLDYQMAPRTALRVSSF